MRCPIVLLASSLLPGALAFTWQKSDSYVGTDFLSDFTHQAISDPTHGRVNYVNQATALAQNLTYANGNTLILRADYWTTLSASGPGRDSVRIQSVKQYTNHVVVFDIRHMPQGCGTWPAAWETGTTSWPGCGEVDIVEGVNDVSPNQMTLHTNPGCTMPASRLETGNPGNNDCEGNNGCGVQATTPNSYGPPFNNNGGGYYAMERMDTDGIKVWFFPRNGNVPNDLASGASTVVTDNWGTPTAFFPNTQCSIDEFFQPNNIIINLTFCGDWAGNSYGASGCPSDCVDYVNQNPGAFVNAYWDIASINVYQNPTGTGSSAPSGSTHQIHPNGDTSKCLDVQGGVMADGTPVQIYDCNGTGAQNWVINPGTTSVQVAGTNYCLDAGSSPASGTQMKIWDCYSGIAAQTWYYTSDERISLQGAGQCLDLTNGSDADGNIMQIWQCTDDDTNQIWSLS